MLLGPDTPTSEVIGAARAAGARLVVISIGCVASSVATRASLAALAWATGAMGAALAVGGRPATGSLTPGCRAPVVLNSLLRNRLAFADGSNCTPNPSLWLPLPG